MLQFIAQTNPRYPVEETVRLAIDGGCRWIQLHLPDLTEEDIRAIAPGIIALCRENSAFLMLEDHPVLAKELGLHGVHLTQPTLQPAAKIREELGPEAVIGVGVSSPAGVFALRSADVDYVTLPASMTLEEIKSFVGCVREAGLDMPIVATGDIGPSEAGGYLSAGVSGIATGMPIIMAPDPIRETELLLASLNSK